MKLMKRRFLPAVVTSCCSAAAVAQPVVEQFDPSNPANLIDVEVTGHILKPSALEPTPERLENLLMPPGFEVNIFAEGLTDPRMMAVADNGAVYVTQRDTGNLVRLMDDNGDGTADSQQVVANRPNMHGIAIDGDTLYLVTVKDIYRTTIQENGDLAPLERLVDDLPDAGQHPNRTIVVGPDDMLYVSVGSTCNACAEPNPENATLLRIAPDGSSRTIYASGLRNTIGFGFAPGTDQIYGMDHGIDWLGDNEQHEELNHIVPHASYGWPYVYGDGQYNPADAPPGELTWLDWAARSINPVGFYTPHAAPMQMAFYTGDQFPEDYQGDAFVAMRGSWNREPPAGYEVVRIEFEGGRPVAFTPFATGFLMQEDGSWGYIGRLAGVAQAQDGSLLVSDDENGVIYRFTFTGESEPDGSDSAPQPTNSEGADIRMNTQAAQQPEQQPLMQLAVDALATNEGAGLNPVSPEFENGAAIPDTYAAEHENISPPLQWDQGPEGTQSYAVIVQDPDAPQDAPFVHWVLYNIPADTQSLSQRVPGTPYLEKPEGALQGVNDRGSIGYFGPRPPQGDPAHHYHFQVFALDTMLDINFGASAAELANAMQGHVLAAGSVVGTYQR